jgi:hypothetical protein
MDIILASRECKEADDLNKIITSILMDEHNFFDD